MIYSLPAKRSVREAIPSTHWNEERRDSPHCDEGDGGVRETLSFSASLMKDWKAVLTDSKTYQIVAVVLIVTAVLWFIRRRKVEQELLDMILISSATMKSSSRSNSGDRTLPPTARIKTMSGKNVYLKRIMAPNAGPLDRQTCRHLCSMFNLRHENLVTFCGAIRHEPGIVAPEKVLVWEYCHHGTLTRVLDNKDIPMDWSFKLSLLMDLARVMYPHACLDRHPHNHLQKTGHEVSAWVQH